MLQLVLIGIGAGAASALLFASIVSGSALSIALFYVASLPILIATVGWSTLTGLIAAAFAAIGLGLVIDWRFTIAFTLGVGAPAWWLGYLAMLARPAGPPDADGKPATLEWYPAGRLVLWTAILGALGVAIMVPYLGFDKQTFEAALRGSFQRMLRAQPGPDGTLQIPGVKDAKALLDLLVAFMPMAAALLGTVVYMLNLWLAGRVVRMSGRLRRPWPDLPSMEFPPIAAALIAAALAGSFLPDIAGVIASIFAVALLIAYGALGLAVVHAITRGINARPIILSVVYALLVLQGWPILIFSLLGLIDTGLDLRGRVARWRGQPPTHQS
jgi:hypothetical protein